MYHALRVRMQIRPRPALFAVRQTPWFNMLSVCPMLHELLAALQTSIPSEDTQARVRSTRALALTGMLCSPGLLLHAACMCCAWSRRSCCSLGGNLLLLRPPVLIQRLLEQVVATSNTHPACAPGAAADSQWARVWGNMIWQHCAQACCGSNEPSVGQISAGELRGPAVTHAIVMAMCRDRFL